MNKVLDCLFSRPVVDCSLWMYLMLAAGIVNAQTPHVSANSGYVISSPTIRVIYWDDDWKNHNPIRRGLITNFVQSLVANRYLAGASQYQVSGATFGGAYGTGPDDIVCGSLRAPSPTVSSRQINDWLLCQLTTPHPLLPAKALTTGPFPTGTLVAGRGPLPPLLMSNDLYVVVLPSGTIISDGLIEVALPGLLTTGMRAVFGNNIFPVFMKRQSCGDDYMGFHTFLAHPTAGALAYAIIPLECVKEPAVDVFLSNGVGFRSSSVWTAAGTYGAGWFVGDFNGDGKDDLMRYINQYGGADVFLSTGSGLSPAGTWSGAGTNGNKWFVGDFNGDRKDDVLRYINQYGGAEVFLSNGSRFASAGTWSGAGTNGHDWFVGDFNGDGKDDVFRYINKYGGAEVFLSNGSRFVSAGTWSGAGTSGHDWFVGDFNGDGKDDVLRYTGPYGGAEVALSNGSAFVSAGIWSSAGTYGSGWFVGDFNGDRKDDVLRYSNQYGGADVLLSDGSRFVNAGRWSTAGTENNGWFVGDFNGDNKADIKRTVSPQWSAANSFNNLTYIISHEIVEAATDPIPAASWTDNSLSLTNYDRLTKGEVADICSVWPAASGGRTTLGGYKVAQYWSNLGNRCVP